MSTTTAPSFQDYFNAGRAEAINRRPELTFDTGDLSEFYMAAAAAMADMLTGYTADRVRVTFLDGASGDDLTTLANDRYNIQRKPAVQATGVLSFGRSAAGPAGTIFAGTVVATDTDAQGNSIQFTTDANLNFALHELGPKTVNATAVPTGPGGNVDVAKIDNVVTTLFDTSITVLNAARFVGGDDEEDDDSLRERVRQFPTTLRRGTLSALEYGALTIASVKRASAVEGVPAANEVTVYVTDITGGSSPQMIADVTTEIENWRAAGIYVQIQGGSLVSQDWTLTLTVRAGVDVNAIRQNIIDAVTARVAKLRIGESIVGGDILKAAAMSVDPNGILQVSVSPSNVDAHPDEIIRAGIITVQ